MYNMQLHYDNRYVQRIQTDNTVGTSRMVYFFFFLVVVRKIFFKDIQIIN